MTPEVQTPRAYRRNCEIKGDVCFPDGMHRYALGIEYHGAAFHGFQKQKSTIHTVQTMLEQALSSVADEPVTLVCAGRTDAGVHATNQVVHFDTEAQRPHKAWIQGVNSKLPDGVRVKWSHETGPLFHSRFSAQSRCYRYVIYADTIRSAIMQGQVSWTNWALDEKRMHAAAVELQGEHNFSSFRAATCQASSPVRCIHHIGVRRMGCLIVLEVSANAFLYHMIRNIAGALIEVGRGAKPPEWIGQLLRLKNRSKAPAMASAQGLYLVAVCYPPEFGLPAVPKGPLFLVPF